MEYHYRVTEKEAKEMFLYARLELWWVYLLFVLAMAAIWNTGVTGWLVALLSSVFFLYTQVKSFRKQWEYRKSQICDGGLRVENGCLVTMGDLNWSCFSCGDVLKIARRGQYHLIKVAIPGYGRTRLLQLVPFRVTGDRKEQQEFERNLREQRKEMQHRMPDEVQQRILEMQFQQEERTWGQVEADYTVEYTWEEWEFKRFRKQIDKAFGVAQAPVPFASFRTEETAAWKIRFTGEAVLFNGYLSNFYRKWEQVKVLLETQELFAFYMKDGTFLFFPKSVIETEADRQEFREYCISHGVEYHRDRYVLKDNPHRLQGFSSKTFRWFAVAVTVVAVAGNILMAMLSLHGGRWADRAVAANETEFVFRPEDYPDYLPLENQIGVLKSLGFQIAPDVIESMKESMEEWQGSRAWIEGSPYYAILSELGYPELDDETWEVTGFSEQAYWFDWEGYDLSEDYIEILNGVSAMSGDEFLLTNPAENLDRVDWDEWTGIIEVSFLVNGTPYQYEVKMEGDWLDIHIVKDINDALEQEQVPGRVYAMEDNGQGCILFYRDAKWVKEFERKTGIRLATEF